MKKRYMAAILAIGIGAGITLCMNSMVTAESGQNAKTTTSDNMIHSKTGLAYSEDKVGTGTPAQKGKIVAVHYSGFLYPTGEKFDSSLDRGEPFEFKLGAPNTVIQGWQEGISGMRVGGKRTLLIPPHLAYGEDGIPPVIPPNSTLRFTVELVEVK